MAESVDYVLQHSTWRTGLWRESPWLRAVLAVFRPLPLSSPETAALMATPRMPSLIPRRPKLVHYAFAAAVGWATSYYTFQPLLEQQVSGHFIGQPCASR